MDCFSFVCFLSVCLCGVKIIGANGVVGGEGLCGCVWGFRFVYKVDDDWGCVCWFRCSNWTDLRVSGVVGGFIHLVFWFCAGVVGGSELWGGCDSWNDRSTIISLSYVFGSIGGILGGEGEGVGASDEFCVRSIW